MKLHSLQAMRAVAAWLVVADHALLEITHNGSEDRITQFAWTLGSGGVYAFFVISGFIMVHVCWESFGRWAASADFLRRRIIRIVPLYWVATIAALAYHRVSATHGANAGWPELATSLAFIPYAGQDGSWTPILPQGWTLNYEMMFYAIFALGLSFPRQLALPAVGVALGGFVVLGPWVPHGTIAYLASPIVLWFMLGVGLAVLWRRRGFQEPAWLAGWVRLLEPFGDASYSTYLVHGLVLTMLLRLWLVANGTLSMWIVPVSLVAVTIAGYATHLAVEKPILRVITRACRQLSQIAAAVR
jgi:exopolysaccharide production protein ExoZ